jgi:hypothetical protein
MSHLKRPNHLRLVGDGPPKPPKPPKEFARRQKELTPEAHARLVTLLRNLRRNKYETYVNLAAALGMSTAAISTVLAGRGGSVNLASRAAYLAGVPVETILYATVVDVDRCPTCKQKLPETKT